MAISNPNPKAFLGKGWAFPLPKPIGGTTQVPFAEFEADVQQSIRIILGTRIGERVMNPEFGSDLPDMVFEPASETTATKISESVRESLIQWEPRIVVGSVETSVNKDQPNRLDVEITYTVGRTNNIFNLVYPFYLQRQ